MKENISPTQISRTELGVFTPFVDMREYGAAFVPRRFITCSNGLKMEQLKGVTAKFNMSQNPLLVGLGGFDEKFIMQQAMNRLHDPFLVALEVSRAKRAHLIKSAQKNPEIDFCQDAFFTSDIVVVSETNHNGAVVFGKGRNPGHAKAMIGAQNGQTKYDVGAFSLSWLGFERDFLFRIKSQIQNLNAWDMDHLQIRNRHYRLRGQ